jgi:large subunit ribosomal protein L23
MKDARDVILRPIVSEKSYGMIEHNRYTFEVEKTASKPEIAQAVEEIFRVTVTRVNTRSWKKAVVSLKEGDSIEFFENR